MAVRYHRLGEALGRDDDGSMRLTSSERGGRKIGAAP
jgi:hypothetical protein